MRYHVEILGEQSEDWERVASFEHQDDAEACFRTLCGRYSSIRLGMDSRTKGKYVLMLSSVKQ